jgi:hypothetical protein
MGKASGIFLGLTYIYVWLILKRGLIGVISVIIANFLSFYIKDRSILDIIRVFCFLCILMIFFIDFKKELLLFRMFHISVISRLLVKLGITLPLVFIQVLLIYYFF